MKLHQQEINELANELLCIRKSITFKKAFFNVLQSIVDFPIIRSRFYPSFTMQTANISSVRRVHIFGMTNVNYKLALLHACMSDTLKLQ